MNQAFAHSNLASALDPKCVERQQGEVITQLNDVENCVSQLADHIHNLLDRTNILVIQQPVINDAGANAEPRSVKCELASRLEGVKERVLFLTNIVARRTSEIQL